MKRHATGKARRGEPTLTASDWAEAALQLVAERGLGALTVGALAARLSVTKGSFYWHFQGRAELLAAALARWEERATTETMRALDAVDDRRQRLVLIIDAASQPPRSRSLYAALAEAGEDPIVRPVLDRVAAARIAYLDDSSGSRRRGRNPQPFSPMPPTAACCSWPTKRPDHCRRTGRSTRMSSAARSSPRRRRRRCGGPRRRRGAPGVHEAPAGPGQDRALLYRASRRPHAFSACGSLYTPESGGHQPCAAPS
jgi:AcrR family transcriptional regulator